MVVPAVMRWVTPAAGLACTGAGTTELNETAVAVGSADAGRVVAVAGELATALDAMPAVRARNAAGSRRAPGMVIAASGGKSSGARECCRRRHVCVDLCRLQGSP